MKRHPAASAKRTRPTRALRSDGAQTRAHILATAAALYAERGYTQTTSKEICERAGTNLAAVNYHFGSRARLYDEVLVEAHRQIVSLDELERGAAAAGDAKSRLCTIVATIVRRANEAQAPWSVRVMVRELMSPSSHAKTLAERAIAPKAAVLKRLVADALGVPETHPSVQRCLAFIIVPAMALTVAPRELRRVVLPALDRDGEAIVDELVAYMSGGIDAVRSRLKAIAGDRPRS